MCGIIGIWDHKQRLKQGQFQKCLDSLTHRGPDDYGIYENDGLFLGMRRLSIIDIEGGNQPMVSSDGDRYLVFNGEIYNYIEIRDRLKARGMSFKSASDSEVLLNSLEKGESGIEDLRGMFAFAHFHKSREELLLCRDRLGVKPLYYLDKPGDCFLFASELKGIVSLCKTLNIKLEIDPTAVYHYLSFLNVPQPRSIYKGIRSMRAGEYMTIRKEGISNVEKYWTPDYHPKFTGSLSKAIERSREIIKESVKIRLRSDVPLGIFLSGGLDSSVVAYEASKLGVDLKTFTVSIVGDQQFDESKVAKNTARQLGLDNIVLPLEMNVNETIQKVVSQYDQPFADPSAIPSLGISELASEYVKVVLNGDGGDEQFAGYRRYVLARHLRKVGGVPKLAGLVLNAISKNPERRSTLGFFKRMMRIAGIEDPEDVYIALTTDTLLSSDKKSIWLNEVIDLESVFENSVYQDMSSLDQQLFADLNLNLLSGLLVKMDIASSAYSLEARSPFLDHQLYEFTAKLPGKYKINRGATKYVLRKAYETQLSNEVVWGKKKGFEVPLNRWLNSELSEMKNDLLLNKSSLIYDYLDYEVVNPMIQYKSHSDKNLDYVIYSLIVLELWLQSNLIGKNSFV